MKKIIFNEGQLKQIYKETDHRTVSFSTGTAAKQTTQLEELNRKFDLIYEQLTMSRTDRFAQKTEKFDYDQLTLCLTKLKLR